jgi:hypothetical protein
VGDADSVSKEAIGEDSHRIRTERSKGSRKMRDELFVFGSGREPGVLDDRDVLDSCEKGG